MENRKGGQLDRRWLRFRKEINQDFKLHVNALVEDFDEKIKLIAEQHLSIMRVLEDHTRRLKAIEEKLIDVDIRLGRVEDQLKRKVDYEEFKSLLKRVTLLESRLSRKI